MSLLNRGQAHREAVKKHLLAGNTIEQTAAIMGQNAVNLRKLLTRNREFFGDLCPPSRKEMLEAARIKKLEDAQKTLPSSAQLAGLNGFKKRPWVVNLKHAICGLGLADCVEDARRMIAAGAVRLDGAPVDRTVWVGAGVCIRVIGKGERVVSRGAMRA